MLSKIFVITEGRGKGCTHFAMGGLAWGCREAGGDSGVVIRNHERRGFSNYRGGKGVCGTPYRVSGLD